MFIINKQEKVLTIYVKMARLMISTILCLFGYLRFVMMELVWEF